MLKINYYVSLNENKSTAMCNVWNLKFNVCIYKNKMNENKIAEIASNIDTITREKQVTSKRSFQ